MLAAVATCCALILMVVDDTIAARKARCADIEAWVTEGNAIDRVDARYWERRCE